MPRVPRVLPRVNLGAQPSFPSFLAAQTTALAAALCSPAAGRKTCLPGAELASPMAFIWGDEPAAAALKRPAREVPSRAAPGAPGAGPSSGPEPQQAESLPGDALKRTHPGKAAVPPHPASPPTSPPQKRSAPRMPPPSAPLGHSRSPQRSLGGRGRGETVEEEAKALLQATSPYPGVVISSRAAAKANRSEGRLFGEGIQDGGPVDGGF